MSEIDTAVDLARIWKKLCALENDIASLVARIAKLGDLFEDLALEDDSDLSEEEEELKRCKAPSNSAILMD